MTPGKKYTIDDLLTILWRRKWLILIPLFVGLVAGWAYARGLPDRYMSETLILMVPPRLREELVRSTAQSRMGERVQTISQQIMSRTRLETIINDLDLYRDARRTGIMEDIVERMRKDVTVQVVRGDAFRVSYVSDRPDTAMKVAERLARLFIDENLRDRELMAQGTSQFLTSQLEDARRRLVEHEKRLEDYRRKHAGELPSQQQSNLAALNNAQMQVQNLIDSTSRDRDRLQLLERMIADATAPGAAPEPVVEVGGSMTGGTAAQQLAAAQASLRAMELRLKPEHPDIIRAKRTIEELERKAEAEALEAPLATDPAPVRPRNPVELARLNRLQQMEDEAARLRSTIQQKGGEEKRLRDLIALYQARAEASPTRETELIELTRDYDTLQRLYASLMAKNEDSKLAANMESRQIGEQFRILDPARVPEKPFSPNRPRMHAIGAIGGLVLGVGLIFLLEYRDTSLKTDEDVMGALALPVLALVPVIPTAEDRRKRRKRRLAVGLASAAGVVLAAGMMAAWILRSGG